MKTVKLKHIYLSIIIYALVLNNFIHAYAAQQNAGIERLNIGIESYENGNYDEAIFNLETSLEALPQDDKENLWNAHFYLGLSYLLLGDAEESKKEFNKAKDILKNKLPDPDVHSPKIVRLFKEALKITKPKIKGMVFVNGGCFDMGDTFGDGQKDEKPVHEVCVDDFYMGQYEVTQGQWENIMGNNPSKYKKWFKKSGNCPVEQVSWNEVQEFIRKLNRKTGESYRLPTEAEWEYAARSGGKKEKYAGFSGESELYLYANFCDKNCEYEWKTKGQNDGYENTSPVGSYKPNGLGLYDMAGNVWEWCSDWYGKGYYSNSPRENPKGASSGYYRVLRGGSWSNGRPRSVRASDRYDVDPDGRDDYLGFRLALGDTSPAEKEVQKPLIAKPPIINLRSSYRNLSLSQVQSLSHISIRKRMDYGFYGHSTINHNYVHETINGDRVVIDNATGLMWHQSGSSNYMKWKKAKKWVKKLNGKGYAGYSDWRLPTVEEAASLLESSKKNGDLYIDAGFDNGQKHIWTGDNIDAYGWGVSFDSGLFDSGLVRCDPFRNRFYVRPVRSGK